jgi:hypothetical protein
MNSRLFKTYELNSVGRCHAALWWLAEPCPSLGAAANGVVGAAGLGCLSPDESLPKAGPAGLSPSKPFAQG